MTTNGKFLTQEELNIIVETLEDNKNELSQYEANVLKLRNIISSLEIENKHISDLSSRLASRYAKLRLDILENKTPKTEDLENGRLILQKVVDFINLKNKDMEENK